MNIRGLMLFCEDIRRLVAFYRDVVGMVPDDPQPFPENRFYRFRSADGRGAGLCLHSGTKPNGGRQKLMLETDDIEGLIARIRAERRSFKPPKPDADGNILFDFYDPERNRIQVYGKL